MLVDGISLVEGSTVTNLVVPTGTAFPSLADAGELFFKTDEGKLYVYSGSLWTAAGVDFDTLHVKEAVRVATTVNITLGGTQTIDGVSVLAGDRVLVKNQSTASQNGIYVASAGGWTRSADFDGAPETEVQAGDFFFVTEGTENADTGWVVSTNGTIQVGTTAINFAQFSGASAMAAGDNTQLQFNNAGAFAGTAQMFYNGTDTLTVGTVDSTFTITSAGTAIGGQAAGDVRIMGGQQNMTSSLGGDVIIQGGPGANLGTTGGTVFLQGGQGIFGGDVRIRTAADGTTFVERLRVVASGAWGLGGANYGSASQVLTSNGSAAAPTWQSIVAPNISGGAAGQIPFQSGPGATTFSTNLTFSSNPPSLVRLAVGEGNVAPVEIYAGGSLNIRTRDAQYSMSVGPGPITTSNDATTTFSDFHGGDNSAGRRAAGAVFRAGDATTGSLSEPGDVILRGGNNDGPLAGGDVYIQGGINAGAGTDGTIFLQTAGEDRIRVLPSGNINFVGTGVGRRLYADFSSAGATRAYLQSAVAAGFSNVGILPGVGGPGAALSVWGGDNPEASSFAQLGHSITLGYSFLDSGASTGGTVRPMVFRIAPSAGTTPAEVARITTAGAWSFGATGTATGTAGQVLTSAGSGAAPTWSTASTVAAAGTLTGTTLAANVVASSLTSVGTLTALTVNGGVRAIGSTGGYATGSNLVMIGTDGSSQPTNIWNNGAAALNNRTWAAYVTSSGGFQLSPVNESGTYGSAISLSRSNITTTTMLLSATAINLSGLTGGLQLNGAAGTAGQLMVSNGAAAAPTWTSSIPSLTVTGTVTASTAPTAAGHLTNKSYVDAVAQGLTTKPAVRTATTANLTATYDNGTAGVGATLTFAGALSAIGGVTLVVGNGVLVKNQTNAFENGRYNVTQLSPGILTRCSLCDEATEIPGAFVFVNEGTLASTGWVQTVANAGTFVVGTDAITVSQFSGAGSYTGGNGLTLSGTTFNVGTASASRIVVNADDIDLATAGTAGTYKSVTTDAYGRVTAGTNPTTLAGYGITDALSTSGGTLTGPLVIGAAQFGTTTTAVTTTTTTVIDSVSSSAYRTVKYVVEVLDSAAVHCVEILVTHRSGTVYKTEYAEVTSGSALGTFDAVVGANLELTFTATAATSKAVKVVRTAIAV